MTTDNFTVTAKNQRLQLAASTDMTRYNITGVYFNERHAVALDGHRMVVALKDECETLTDTIVQFRKPKMRYNKRQVYGGETYVAVPNTGQFAGSNFPENNCSITDGRFPDYKLILDTVPAPSDSTVQVNFDIKHLIALADSLRDEQFKSTQTVTLTFDSKDDTAPILITTNGRNDAFGLLMPMRIEGHSPLSIYNKVK